jgi:3-deoxy-manno-octulosonate cytidylyltransferase (CMP-KDO synthetase)
MVDEAVRPLLTDERVKAGTLVRIIDNEADLHNPGVVKVVLDIEGNCLYFSRSPIPFARDHSRESWAQAHRYYKHIGLYVYRRDFLLQMADRPRTPLEMTEQLEQLRILENGERIRATITVHDTIPVDTADDLKRVRERMEALV